MSVGTYADYRHYTGLAGCLYGVIFNTSHNFFVIVKSLMEIIRFIYYLIMHNFVSMRAFVEEGSTFFLISIFILYILIVVCQKYNCLLKKVAPLF